MKAPIAPYKYPRSVIFVDALPKTATGKIQRFALRAAAARSAPEEGCREGDTHDRRTAAGQADGRRVPRLGRAAAATATNSSTARSSAMAAERLSHARAKLAAANALAEQSPRAAAVRGDDRRHVGSRSTTRTVYEPDALVRCGARAADDAIEVATRSSSSRSSRRHRSASTAAPSSLATSRFRASGTTLSSIPTRGLSPTTAAGDGDIATRILRDGRSPSIRRDQIEVAHFPAASRPNFCSHQPPET